MYLTFGTTVFCSLCTFHVESHSCFSRSGQSLLESAVKVDGANLQLLSLTSDLNGLYKCEASNAYGSKHGQLYVHVTSGEVLAVTVCSNLSFVSFFFFRSELFVDVVMNGCLMLHPVQHMLLIHVILPH